MAATLAVSCGGRAPAPPATPAAAISVVGPWTDVEATRFGRVLDHFRSATRLRVTYIPAPDGVAVTLDRRRAAGLPTDVAFLPQPGLLRQYAGEGRLVPLDASTAGEVRANYSTVWQDLGSVGGNLYGVWYKAADKSLVWYDIADFEQAGVIPPGTLDGLLQVAGRLHQSGITPFAVAASREDTWNLTDWFENLYLTMEGPQRYQLLAQHRLAWTDPSVIQTLQMLKRILQPDFLAGGTAGALRTSFVGSVEETFDPPAGRVARVAEGAFVAGVITGSTPAQLGLDADEFRFPPQSPQSPWIIGGGDAAVLLSRSPGAEALVRYLASPDAGAVWASMGGFISPNLNVGLGVYPDAISRSLALSVLDAGDSFLFDLSDLQPAVFGSTPGRGLFVELQRFLAGDDARATAARLEAEASAAYRP
ncbi:MAG TPA: ABC transporter substrate-binding protein [Acidimicrobiales bacterium]|nr:ABC transporter substrate-binding protein [Acidimicrobiales bacterium]